MRSVPRIASDPGSRLVTPVISPLLLPAAVASARNAVRRPNPSESPSRVVVSVVPGPRDRDSRHVIFRQPNVRGEFTADTTNNTGITKTNPAWNADGSDRSHERRNSKVLSARFCIPNLLKTFLTRELQKPSCFS